MDVPPFGGGHTFLVFPLHFSSYPNEHPLTPFFFLPLHPSPCLWRSSRGSSLWGGFLTHPHRSQTAVPSCTFHHHFEELIELLLQLLRTPAFSLFLQVLAPVLSSLVLPSLTVCRFLYPLVRDFDLVDVLLSFQRVTAIMC